MDYLEKNIKGSHNACSWFRKSCCQGWKESGRVVSKSNVAAGTDGTSLVNTIVTETVKVVTETVMAEAVRVDTETPSVGSGEDYWKTDLAGTIMSGIQDSISDEFIETIVTITGSITTILRETPVVDEL